MAVIVASRHATANRLLGCWLPQVLLPRRLPRRRCRCGCRAGGCVAAVRTAHGAASPHGEPGIAWLAAGRCTQAFLTAALAHLRKHPASIVLACRQHPAACCVLSCYHLLSVHTHVHYASGVRMSISHLSNPVCSNLAGDSLAGRAAAVSKGTHAGSGSHAD